jgi:hypothetical protein
MTTTIKYVCEDYNYIKETVAPISDTAAALLILAVYLNNSATFNRAGAENFGHELAMALKNVLQESQIRIVKES